jgi:hypothetical protein
MADLEFIQVGDLAKGIREESAPSLDDLRGRSLRLFFEDGSVMHMSFTGARDLSWAVVEGPGKGTSGEETYSASCPREGIYFIDYVSATQRATSVSLVVDFGSGDATMVVGTLPTQAEVQKGAFALANEGADLSFVRAQFLRAAIDRPFKADDHHHAPTNEMAGKRVMYVYSPTETYEHIYLNEKLYTWQCLAGIEKGLADTDRCHSYKLGDALYLFVWREKIVPTLGVVIADWREMKSRGKLFGYESNDFGKLVNAPIASSATLLNVTTHPGLES